MIKELANRKFTTTVSSPGFDWTPVHHLERSLTFTKQEVSEEPGGFLCFWGLCRRSGASKRAGAAHVQPGRPARRRLWDLSSFNSSTAESVIFQACVCLCVSCHCVMSRMTGVAKRRRGCPPRNAAEIGGHLRAAFLFFGEACLRGTWEKKNHDKLEKE